MTVCFSNVIKPTASKNALMYVVSLHYICFYFFRGRDIYEGESDYRKYPSDRPDEIEEGEIPEMREYKINPNESYSAHKYKRRYGRNKRLTESSQRRAENIVDSADEISA